MGTTTRIMERLLYDGDYRPGKFLDVMNSRELFKEFRKELLDRSLKTKDDPFPKKDEYFYKEPTSAEAVADFEDKDITRLTEAGEDALVAWLADRLSIVDPEKKWNPVPEYELVRWVKGEARPLYEQADACDDNAIKLCFALKLNDQETEGFFYRGGISQRAFDVRDSRQMIYRLCLSLGRPYSEAMGIIEEFEEYKIKNPITQEETAGTTKSLVACLDDSMGLIRESGSEAISKYLVENRAEFEHESETVWRRYLRVRAKLCMALVEHRMREDHDVDSLKYALKWLIGIEEDEGTGLYDQDERRIGEVIAQMKSIDSSQFKNDDEMLWQSVSDGWREISDSLLDNPDCGARRMVSLLTAGALYKWTFASGRPRRRLEDSRNSVDAEVEGRAKRRGGAEAMPVEESSFPRFFKRGDKRAFFGYFPNRQAIQFVDKGPSCQKYNIHYARKAIVLFYFFEYSYRWTDARRRGEDDRFGFDGFKSGLDTLLGQCNLSPLYAADPCDLLVMKSVRAYDPECNSSGNLRKPTDFFTWVVSESFFDDENDL